jgi:hypothetical protein
VRGRVDGDVGGDLSHREPVALPDDDTAGHVLVEDELGPRALSDLGALGQNRTGPGT